MFYLFSNDDSQDNVLGDHSIEYETYAGHTFETVKNIYGPQKDKQDVPSAN